MIKALYDWMMGLAGHRRAVPALAAVSFAESSFFPIPPDVMLIPMVLANRSRAWYYATVATVSSVLGGLAGYAIGYFLYDTVGQAVLNLYGYTDKFADFSERYNDYGAWIVFIAGTTPFPYKVITIASGVTALNLPVFMAASVAARGLRFFIVAGLLWKFGPPVREFIERRLNLMFILFVVLLVGGFVVAKYIV